MYLEDYARAKGKLRYWNEMLHEWLFMVHRVNRVSKKESAVYAHKERTNVGLLAAAAIRNGWVALEENLTKKHSRGKTKELYPGRTDLTLWRGNHYHEVEAKLVRVRLPYTKTDTTKIRRARNNARKDSIHSPMTGKKNDHKVAMTFVVPIAAPEFLQKTEDKEIKKHLDAIIKNIRKDYNPQLLSYTFPGPVKLQGRNFGLGIIMFGELLG